MQHLSSSVSGKLGKLANYKETKLKVYVNFSQSAIIYKKITLFPQIHTTTQEIKETPYFIEYKGVFCLILIYLQTFDP